MDALKKNTIWNTDLDNTLIYSYKRDIGEEKKCVEIYENREISFMTPFSYQGLQQIKDWLCIVPTTTRTAEQYHRVNLGFIPRYALVCNGGLLLEDGQKNSQWLQESQRIIQKSKQEMIRAIHLLEKDSQIFFEIRYVEELFVFTKSHRPDESQRILMSALDSKLVEVHCNGKKVYVIPKGLDKGTGIQRLRQRLKPKQVIGAGDSVFDIPMLHLADISFADRELQRELADENGTRKRQEIQSESFIRFPREGELLADYLVASILEAKSALL